MSNSESISNERDADRFSDHRVRSTLSQIEEALRGLRFGQVTLTVQDGVVVLLERTEKKRLV